MPRDLSRSRSPLYRRRLSPSPLGHRYSRRSRRDRSRSPYSYSRRKSRSISPRRNRSRSRTPRHHRSRSPTSRSYKKQRRRSSSSSLHRRSSSSSLGSIEQKSTSEKLKKEEERKRRQQESQAKLLKEETNKRVEEAIRKEVEERLNSDNLKLDINKKLEEGRTRLNEEVTAQLEKEKEAALVEARRKENNMEPKQPGEEEEKLPNPLQAALASAIAFSVGAVIPLVAAVFIRDHKVRLGVVAAVASLTLLVFGIVGAILGRTPVGKSAARVVVGGWMAMAITFGLTKLLGSKGL